MKMVSRKFVLLYPLLPAVFPVLFLASQNQGEMPVAHILSALAVIVPVTLLATILLALLVRDISKAAVLVLPLLVVFFSYGHVYELFESISLAGVAIGRHRYLVPLALIGILASSLGILLYQQRLTRLLQSVALVFLALVLLNVAQLVLSSNGPQRVTASNVQPAPGKIFSAPDPTKLPDIYYIILDGYSRADVLEEFYNFDNSDFLAYLSSKGFYVAAQSQSNYMHTNLSLPSSLNMDYVGETDDIKVLYRNNRSMKLAKQMGYSIVHLNSGWQLTQENPLADLSFNAPVPSWKGIFLNDFSEALLRSTAARLFDVERFFVRTKATYIQYNLKKTRELPGLQQPTFSFIHFTLPHPPFIVDAQGKMLQSSSSDPDLWTPKSRYVDQIRYLNDKMKEIVDEILSQSSVEPIIILQADHGSRSSADEGDSRFTNEVFLYEASGILNAYKLPQYCDANLYPSISPVNSFRMVFNSCFGTEFDLLEDKVFYTTNSGPPWGFLPAYLGSRYTPTP